MAILTNGRGHIFLEFIEIDEAEIADMVLEAPLTHALLVIRYEGKYLLMFNKWKKHWELPGGIIDEGETPRECAVRELLEETNQSVQLLEFKGLMKFQLKPDDRIEYGALFSGSLQAISPFQANDEAEQIVFWDTVEDIGHIDEIDKKLLEFY
ncbi:NUDIX hydrolase [Paenibacillus contaminans]|uniref:NUDIX hydrolase n=1 Tax=Paenibacillus contaminans TaxID=450362 RepID=A0A329MC97_9BACL|nr:NUDIX domain-containing protein [Paenibacillus contaminans]RAV17715.1 NUDIX hydrolase [Paenibacillus contaminans]